MVPRPGEIVRRRLTVVTVLRIGVLGLAVVLTIPWFASAFYWLVWIAINGPYTQQTWGGSQTTDIGETAAGMIAMTIYCAVIYLFAWIGWLTVPFFARRLVPFRAINTCPKCRYPLQGLVDPMCPECGIPLGQEYIDISYGRPVRWSTHQRSVRAARQSFAAIFRFIGILAVLATMGVGIQAVVAVYWYFVLQEFFDLFDVIAWVVATLGTGLVTALFLYRADHLAAFVVPSTSSQSGRA